ncbi:MAG: hypothetical protein QXO75_06910 [Nitrososphaerota archaeon]
MGITLAEVYKCRLDEGGLRLIDTFNRMVKWWVDRAGSQRWSSYRGFRGSFYRDWLKAFPEWSTQLAHTSSLEAYSRIRLYREPREWAIAAELNTPVAVLHPKMLKIEKGYLRITARRTKVKEDRYIYVELEPINKQQRELLKQVEKRLWKIGQVILAREWALISFRARRMEPEVLEIVERLLIKG